VTDWERVTHFESLYRAHLNLRKGRSNRRRFVKFELNLGQNLIKLQQELLSGNYQMKGYRHFQIREPKTRDIYDVSYQDKIIMTALCDEVLIPRVQKSFIFDNIACQKGKGTHFGLKRLTEFLRQHYRVHGNQGYILKCDISKYFENINHQVLKDQLSRYIKDQQVLALLHHYIDSFHTPNRPNTGQPLGNQTSQWFALLYLNELDHYIKEKLRIKHYIRYMDDFILLHHNKTYLWQCLKEIEQITNKLGLRLNPKTAIFPIKHGVEFLGWRFFLRESGKIVRKIKTQSKLRFKRRIRHVKKSLTTGQIDLKEAKQIWASYKGHLKHGHTYRLEVRSRMLGVGEKTSEGSWDEPIP